MFEHVEHFIYMALAVMFLGVTAFAWALYQLWDWMVGGPDESDD